jgi:hypothetical protein
VVTSRTLNSGVPSCFLASNICESVGMGFRQVCSNTSHTRGGGSICLESLMNVGCVRMKACDHTFHFVLTVKHAFWNVTEREYNICTDLKMKGGGGGGRALSEIICL